MPGSRIGEVLESSTIQFRAACDELHCSPPFGSLVQTSDGDLTIYGLVYEAATASSDPGRNVLVRGMHEDDEESVYRNNPQLELLLRTDFRALIVGFHDGTGIRHYLSPRPPRVHAFVYLTPIETAREFYSLPDFVTVLASLSVTAPVDELIAACLRQAVALAGADGDKYLIKAGKQLVVQLNGDPIRVSAILRRVRP